LKLEIKGALWEHFHVKLRTDNRARLDGQDVLKPNTDYEAETKGNRIVLVEILPEKIDMPKARLVKVGGRLLAAGAKVTNEDTQKVMAEFP
jgi:hypothetical protein